MEKIPDTAFDDFLALISAYPDYVFLWKFADPKKAHMNKLKEYNNVHIKGWLNQMALLGNKRFYLIHLNNVYGKIDYAQNIGIVPFRLFENNYITLVFR
jgi:hypothetical protein